MTNTLKEYDLGLSYEQAAHGMQTAVSYEMGIPERQRATEPKHLRVGVNSALVCEMGLARLLMDKGVITNDEYIEYQRLAMNFEVYRYQQMYPGLTFR